MSVRMLVGLLIGLTLVAPAWPGAFTGAREGRENLVKHPKGYSGPDTFNVVVDVCIVSGSPNAEAMEVPLQNAIDQFNRMVPTTSNLRFGADNQIASNQFDWESAALHELGHCIGLAHPNLASESGVDPAFRDYTRSTDGPNNAFDFNAGPDSRIGSTDDLRGDDGNLHYYEAGVNNPFVEPARVDASTYTLDLAGLPSGHGYVANANRDVDILFGFPNSEAVMQQGQSPDEEQRSLAADDTATLRYARTGLDRTAGTSDDYLVRLNYGGISASACDVNVAFDAAETSFAVCSTSSAQLTETGDSNHHYAITRANVYYNPENNWHFSTTRTPDPRADSLRVAVGAEVTQTVQGETSLLANDGGPGLVLGGGTFPGPEHGSVTLYRDGTFRYEHDGGDGRSDQFVYRVCRSIDANACAHQRVDVVIFENTRPRPGDDFVAISEGGRTGTLVGGSDSLLANDFDPEGDLLTVTTTPVGTPRFGDLVLFPDGTFEYDHRGGENDNDVFTYEACDDGNPSLCANATVSISIRPVNDPPRPGLDSLTVAEGGNTNLLDSGSSNLLSNDRDDENDNLVLRTTPVSGPALGDVFLNASGTFRYFHGGGESPSDAFVYRVCDDGNPSECSDATVNITVLPVNDEPLASTDAIAVREGESTASLRSGAQSLLANDTDPEGGTLIVDLSGSTSPFDGTLSLQTDGTFLYEHGGKPDTQDGFQYRVCDDGEPRLCVDARVSVEVELTNDAPDPEGDEIDVLEGGTATTTRWGDSDLLANDSDEEYDLLSVSPAPLSGPDHGSVVLQPDGAFEYTHGGGEADSDSFVYEVCDDGEPSECSPATVAVYVQPVNDAPEAGADSLRLLVGSTATETAQGNGSLLANDTDPEGGQLTMETAPLDAPARGTLTLFADGRFRYEHDGSGAEADSFRYLVCDDHLPPACSEAEVSISLYEQELIHASGFESAR